MIDGGPVLQGIDAPLTSTACSRKHNDVFRACSAQVSCGSKALFRPCASHFWSTPNNVHRQTGPVGPVRAKPGLTLPVEPLARVTAKPFSAIQEMMYAPRN